MSTISMHIPSLVKSIDVYSSYHPETKNGRMDRQTDGHTDAQHETIIPHHYCMAGYRNMAARGRCLFSIYIYIENFKNVLVINQWTDFNITWQECFFGDPLSRLRLFKPSRFVKKTWQLGGRAYFPYYVYRKL